MLFTIHLGKWIVVTLNADWINCAHVAWQPYYLLEKRFVATIINKTFNFFNICVLCCFVLYKYSRRQQLPGLRPWWRRTEILTCDPPSISVNTALSSGPLTLQWMITDGERSADITSAQKDARLMWCSESAAHLTNEGYSMFKRNHQVWQ